MSKHVINCKSIRHRKKSISNNSENRLFYFILIVLWTLNCQPHHAVIIHIHVVTLECGLCWVFKRLSNGETHHSMFYMPESFVLQHFKRNCRVSQWVWLRWLNATIWNMLQHTNDITTYKAILSAHCDFTQSRITLVAREKIPHHFVCTDVTSANHINDTHNGNQFAKLHRRTFQFRSFFGAWAVVTCAFCVKNIEEKNAWWICSSKF